MSKIRILGPALAALAGLLHAADQPVPRAELPVSVSSANYAADSSEEVFRAVHEKMQVNPATPALKPLSQPRHFVFAPGESFESDLTFAQVCAFLAPALAKKGYLNAADEAGRIAAPEKIELILRVTSGGRRWRDPTVRTEMLRWRDNLVPRKLSEAVVFGLETAWDSKAGGNDNALGAVGNIQDRQDASATGGSGIATIAGSQTTAAPVGYESSRDFYLIVVDAFDYDELQKKKGAAKRQWTTFIAMPREGHQKFSEVIATMLKVGTPYFGETTRGLQAFDDARARVEIGTPEVVETDVKVADPKK
jgi:hypothetical protein